MTGKTGILTDSTSDIPQHLQEALDVIVIDAYVHFGKESFTSSNMSLEEFHRRAASATKVQFPKTSQPSAQDILKGYEKLKADGAKDILSIHVSNKLSGTVNSANVAAGMMEDVNVHVIDTGCVSGSLLACIIEARKLLDEGVSAEETTRLVSEFGTNLTGYFSLKTLDNLVKGGRMSPLRYRLGRLLNIKPILKIHQGLISPHDKTRGEVNAQKLAYQAALVGKDGSDEFNYIIAHTQSIEIAEKYKKQLLEEYPKVKGHVIEIGIGVSVHVGAGAFFILIYD